MTITAGVGATWDEVLKEIDFPKYCLPLFPNNPGQKIKIGGTAAVGGIGPYTSSSGGFWKIVKSLKLVTMQGEIINCSPTENVEYFQYSLGGLGRIGVMTELTLEVLPSKKDLLFTALYYSDKKQFLKDIDSMFKSNKYEGIAAVVDNSIKLTTIINKRLHIILASYELNEGEGPETAFENLKYSLGSGFPLFVNDEDHDNDIDMHLKAVKFPKSEYVYYYPNVPDVEDTSLFNVWSDCIIPKRSYLKFEKEMYKIISKYDLEDYLVKQSILDHKFDLDVILSYVIKNEKTPISYPLSLDINDGEDYYFAVGFFPCVPYEKLQDAISAIEDITDLAFECGGKKYMYGFNNLSKEQLELQYGRDVLLTWNRLKKELDPNNLLNIGVIDGADEYK